MEISESDVKLGTNSGATEEERGEDKERNKPELTSFLCARSRSEAELLNLSSR